MEEEEVVESVFIFLFSLVDLTFVLIAVVYMNSCPKEHMICIYNIVSGFFDMSSIIIDWYLSDWPEWYINWWNIIARTLEGMWLAAGTYWTFHIFPPDYVNENSPEYCHRVFYVFSTVTISISCIIYISILAFETIKWCRSGRGAGELEKPVYELKGNPEILRTPLMFPYTSSEPRSPVKSSGKILSLQGLELKQKLF